MAHPFAADARQRDLHAAPVADHALVFDALIFSAGAFPIPGRTKNAFAEEAAFLRLKRAVIDRLGIFDLAFAPRPHRIAGSNTDCDLIKSYRTLFAH